jgi:hypothetical protein
LKRHEAQQLDVDSVCLPPFDVDRLLRDTQEMLDNNPLETAIYAPARVFKVPAGDAPAPLSPQDTAPTTSRAARQDGRRIATLMMTDYVVQIGDEDNAVD